jgi:hypothetical protein
MILGCDTSSFGVKYQSNICAVVRRESEKNAFPRFSLPLWELLSIFKSRMKHINWAAENSCFLEDHAARSQSLNVELGALSAARPVGTGILVTQEVHTNDAV